VTIIAGFRCFDGVVICADTQATVPGLSKKHVSKVHVEPFFRTDEDELVAAFCGAGDGPFIDMLTRKAWAAASGERDIDAACDAIEQRIKDVYKEYGAIYQPGALPQVELIYGVKTEADNRLYHASGPIVNIVEEHCSGGAGYYMADFLTARMHSRSLSLHQLVILAAYILFQAKEHVDGCGGESHIAILRNSGKSGLLDPNRVLAITGLVDSVDHQLGQLLLEASVLTDEWNTDSQKRIGHLNSTINFLRQRAQDNLASAKALQIMPTINDDEYGFGDYDSELFMPSDPQTSEDPQ